MLSNCGVGEVDNSATLGKARMLAQGAGGGHAALVLKSIQNKVAAGSLCVMGKVLQGAHALCFKTVLQKREPG